MPTPHMKVMGANDRTHANEWLVGFLHATIAGEKDEVGALRRKLTITYWRFVGLTVSVCILGVGLLVHAAVGEALAVVRKEAACG